MSARWSIPDQGRMSEDLSIRRNPGSASTVSPLLSPAESACARASAPRTRSQAVRALPRSTEKPSSALAIRRRTAEKYSRAQAMRAAIESWTMSKTPPNRFRSNSLLPAERRRIDGWFAKVADPVATPPAGLPAPASRPAFAKPFWSPRLNPGHCTAVLPRAAPRGGIVKSGLRRLTGRLRQVFGDGEGGLRGAHATASADLHATA